MKIHTFARGVHPREGKSLAEDASLEVLPIPESIKVPMSQHIGGICQPVVKARDTVEAGQIIGEAAGFVSAAVHTPFPGTVTKISAVTLANGRHVPAVIIKVDKIKTLAQAKNEVSARLGTDEISDDEIFEAYAHNLRKDFFTLPENFDLDTYSTETIFSLIQAAGLVGQGGAAFPTHVKLAKDEKFPIDTLLINGCECEPYLTADYRLMLEAGELIITGALLAGKVLGASKILLCVEDNKPKAVENLQAIIARKGLKNIFVAVMRTKYPQGGEKQLIQAALGRKVAVGALPKSVGAAVINVGTAVSVTHAVTRKTPLLWRAVTVTGEGIHRPTNILAPIGASFQDLISHCGGLKPHARRILAGGPMMGFSVGSTDIPVTKGTSGITILTDTELSQTKQTNCLRCGRCVSVCPMRLIPTKLATTSRAKAWDTFIKYHPLACVECGCCSYECPAAIPIVQLIRVGKIEINKRNKK
ncbi:MAG: electron transport complex subunit RsxC [Planctomycetia bacterium]|nr:electron transport complex subunit RsxC [Planctomycetia bacterium]